MALLGDGWRRNRGSDNRPSIFPARIPAGRIQPPHLGRCCPLQRFGRAALAQAPAGPCLTVATGGSITLLDPHFFNAAPNTSLALHIFNTLTERTANAQLVPGLATAWRSVEPTIWEFKPREGVHWHDGRPFTAEDVAFTMQRAPSVPNSPGSFGGFIRSIARSEIVDAHTVCFHTHAPNPILPNELGTIFMSSQQGTEGAATEDCNASRTAIGIGLCLCRFAAHRPGDRTELVCRENYWGGVDPWARVSCRFVADDVARSAAMLAGDIDMIDHVASSESTHLKSDPRVNVSEFRTPWSGAGPLCSSPTPRPRAAA